MLGVSEEPVLGEKAGEEHPVPVLVRNFVDEMVQTLGVGLAILQVSDLPTAQPESVPE